MVAGPRTEDRQAFPRVPGGGADLVVDPLDIDDVVRCWVTGDAFPRIVLDVGAGEVLIGDGTIAPQAISAGSGAPTNASYVTTAAEAGLSAEQVLGTLFTFVADVPALGAAAPAGRIRYVQDIDALYMSDGAAWNAIVLAAAQISDFVEAVQDVVGAAVVAGTGITVTYNDGAGTVTIDSTGGAPTGADYLVGTAQGGLSAEIVVGATPGGELGGTWASPTVDASHSGSTHAAVQAAAEATAAAALAGHTGASSDAHNITDISISATDKLAGRDTAGAGDCEEIGLGNGIEFDGAGNIRTKQQMSVTADASGLLLSGDAAAPGNTQLYGTNGAGAKGWYAQPGGVSDGDKGDIVVSGAGTVWDIDANAVGNAELRDSTALTVIGRSANSTGDPADIAAAVDGEVLRRSGTTLGFGTVATAGLADDAVSNAKLANMAQALIKGRASGAGTGDPTDLTAAEVRTILGGARLYDYDDGKVVSTTTSVTSIFDTNPSFGAATIGETLLVVAGGYVFNNSGSARALNWGAKIGASTPIDIASGTFAAHATNKWPYMIIAEFSIQSIHASIGVAHVRLQVLVTNAGTVLGDTIGGAKSVIGASLFSGDTTGPPTVDVFVTPGFSDANFQIHVQSVETMRFIP